MLWTRERIRARFYPAQSYIPGQGTHRKSDENQQPQPGRPPDRTTTPAVGTARRQAILAKVRRTKKRKAKKGAASALAFLLADVASCGRLSEHGHQKDCHQQCHSSTVTYKRCCVPDENECESACSCSVDGRRPLSIRRTNLGAAEPREPCRLAGVVTGCAQSRGIKTPGFACRCGAFRTWKGWDWGQLPPSTSQRAPTSAGILVGRLARHFAPLSSKAFSCFLARGNFGYGSCCCPVELSCGLGVRHCVIPDSTGTGARLPQSVDQRSHKHTNTAKAPLHVRVKFSRRRRIQWSFIYRPRQQQGRPSEPIGPRFL